MAGVEALKVVSSAWAKTLAAYEKQLNTKEFLDVQEITSPTDVAKHVEDLEAKRRSSKHGAIADRVHAVTGRLIQFSSVLDAITSSNLEASLIWGSLKLLLTIVHRTSGQYYKVCESILAVGNSLPSVELLAKTFDHSELVCSHIVAFYESVLQFWSKALKFYRGKRLFKLSRVWYDFDSEFDSLNRDLKRHGKAIEKAVAAVHMNESRMARIEQTTVNRELIEAKRSVVTSNHHRDIVKWLAPLNHEASYFADDLRSAYGSRQPGTCTWILDRPEFKAWMKSGLKDAATRMLWLTGVPGAGKTVLSSFVIHKCPGFLNTRPNAPVLYFFFKATDSDKNSVLSVTRSLVYQLYLLFPASLSADIVSLKDDGGKDNALSDRRLWDLFVKHAKDTADLTIVLDALDECDGADVLLGRMTLLLQCCGAKMFVVSRKEENIARALEEYPNIIITHEDIEADIHSYIVAEIGKIARFRGKSVQQRIIRALSTGHDGMFLWTYLMIEELKELGTVRQVDVALRSLPMGLEKLHEVIITRLDATLRSAHRQLAIKILMWVVCAVRPLRLVELQEILRFENRGDGTAGQLPVDDGDLLYAEKDIELACGALVLTRNGTLQLIHLSTKEILLSKPKQMPPSDPRLAFYVDAQRENPHMATLYISYMSTHLNGIESLTRPDLEAVSRLSITKESYDSTDLVKRSPFIDYASISWQAHLIEGSLALENTVHQLQALLTYDLTILWIELCVSLHQDIFWTLERGCKDIMSWADYASVPAESSCHDAIAFLWAWSYAVLSVITEYGRVLRDYPYEIHYLDLQKVLRSDSTPGSPVLPTSFKAAQGGGLQEQISEIHAVDRHPASVKVDPRRQLQRDTEDPHWSDTLGFLLYDSRREVYFTAEYGVSNETEVLWVQERATGRTLQPVRSPLYGTDIFHPEPESLLSPFKTRVSTLANAVLTSDNTYLAILYQNPFGYYVISIWIIEHLLDFQDIRQRRPWARRLHCFGAQNTLFVDSCLPLTVGPGPLFYWPGGEIHPDRGIQKRIPKRLVDSTDKRTHIGGKEVILAFAGNGQILVKLDRSDDLVEQISWLDTIVDLPPSRILTDHTRQDLIYLEAVSQTARFMVYATHLRDNSVVFHILDFCGNLNQLQVGGPRPDSSTVFKFSRDERFLLGIAGSDQKAQDATQFWRWAVTEPSLVCEVNTNLFIPGFDPYSYHSGGQLCVAEEHSSIILVSEDRVLYELDSQRLNFSEGTLLTSQGTDSPHLPYCNTDYKVSKNGSRVVGLYIRCPKCPGLTTYERDDEQSASPDISKTLIGLHIVDLLGTPGQVKTITLEYSDTELSALHTHDVTFSPDLSILQAGAHIFDLLEPGHPRLSFPDSPLTSLPRKKGTRILFSTCNGYLIIIEGKHIETIGEHAKVGLFRIYRDARVIERIAIAGLDDLAADGIEAAFHPELPLLLLTYITYQGNDIEDMANATKVMEIELEASKLVQVDIPKQNFIMPICGQREFQGSYRIPQAQFSDCGSFCFLHYTYPVFGVLMLHSTLLEYRQAERRKPTVWGHRTSYNGHLYEVGWRHKPTMVTLYRAYDLPDANGLRDSFSLPTTDSVAITAFPIHLANSKIHLLAGENGDDLVRILFLPRKGPPEVKYLRVTLNQILAKLEESAIAGNAYRKRVRRSHRKERQVKSEEAALSGSEDRLGTEGSDADESSNVDSEEAANSVGGDDSESHDTD